MTIEEETLISKVRLRDVSVTLNWFSWDIQVWMSQEPDQSHDVRKPRQQGLAVVFCPQPQPKSQAMSIAKHVDEDTSYACSPEPSSPRASQPS